MTGTEGQLVLEGLTTAAGSFHLGPIDLQVDAGEVLVVLGPSGAGKTTLLDTIAGFRPPLAGRVQLAGRDVTGAPPEQRGIGVVFQHAALFPHLSVRDNVRFGPRARGENREKQLEDLLARFGLVDHADRRPRSLSGGERQRVALARALAGEPDLLLLDEPLSALDQPTREDLRGVLQDLLSDLRIPAVHVTHDREEALILADDIAVIVNGQLRQVQPASEIVSCPDDADVARILGWAELGTGTIQQGTIALGDLRLPTADESGIATVLYRPESISLAPRKPTSAFRVTRTIEQIRPTVPLARVLLAGDPPITALVLQRDLDELDAGPGQAIEIELPPQGVKTFTARPRPIADPTYTRS